MQDSAKNAPPSVKAKIVDRDGLVREARRWVMAEGSVTEFARLHGKARSTVRGWLKGHDGHRGRNKKLGPFEETEIFKLLLADACLQNWKTVQEIVRRQSGESISRRSVFRLLRKWGFVSLSTELGETTSVEVIPWEQPQKTLQTDSKVLNGMLWKIHSGRGTEGFMLTSGESADELERVVTAISGRLRGRKRSMLTNHPRLAEPLRKALPQLDLVLKK
jgi:hypothetical protein